MDITELRRLGARRVKLLRELEDVSERIRQLAVEALRADVPPTDVQKLAGYSHAQVRNMARAAGIPPARRGRAAA